jgi:ribonuclease HI
VQQANAMKQMIYRPNINKKKIVVLVDSKAGIQAINNFKKTNETTEEIRSAYQIIMAQGNYVILQWIPSHVGLSGNKQTDYLAKKRHSCKSKTKTTVESRQKIEREKTISGIQQSKRTGPKIEG